MRYFLKGLKHFCIYAISYQVLFLLLQMQSEKQTLIGW